LKITVLLNFLRKYTAAGQNRGRKWRQLPPDNGQATDPRLREARSGSAISAILALGEECNAGVDFQCHTILDAVQKGFYQKFHNVILSILTKRASWIR
jgi:hypothetical protein